MSGPRKKQAAEADGGDTGRGGGTGPGGTGAGGDDVKAAFRRALERKSAHHHPDEDHRDAHGAPGAANDTTKRVFRRKSG